MLDVSYIYDYNDTFEMMNAKIVLKPVDIRNVTDCDGLEWDLRFVEIDVSLDCYTVELHS